MGILAKHKTTDKEQHNMYYFYLTMLLVGLGITVISFFNVVYGYVIKPIFKTFKK